MKNKKKCLLSLILALCLCMALATPAWANDVPVLDNNNLSEMDLALFATALINGDIQPVNEAENDNISFDIVSDTTINEQSANLCGEEQTNVTVSEPIIDIRKIQSNNQNNASEEYMATIIYTNQYEINNSDITESDIMPLLNRYEDEELCDVVVACSVIYDKILIEADSYPDIPNYGYKIKTITGICNIVD